MGTPAACTAHSLGPGRDHGGCAVTDSCFLRSRSRVPNAPRLLDFTARAVARLQAVSALPQPANVPQANLPLNLGALRSPALMAFSFLVQFPKRAETEASVFGPLTLQMADSRSHPHRIHLSPCSHQQGHPTREGWLGALGCPQDHETTANSVPLVLRVLFLGGSVCLSIRPAPPSPLFMVVFSPPRAPAASSEAMSFLASSRLGGP